MRETKSAKPAATPWRFPVALETIGETEEHFDLAADASVRAAIAELTGLRELPRLAASFDVARHGGGGLRVIGHVSADVGQTCVVTLEPLTNQVEEDIDLTFAPVPSVDGVETGTPAGAAAATSDLAPSDLATSDAGRVRHDKWSGPEPLIGGVVDLGALATEFLVLGLDPYPRKSGAVFEPPPDVRPQSGPFAALAKLAKDPDKH